MSNRLNLTIKILSFAILIALISSGLVKNINEKQKFKKLGEQISNYQATTRLRIAKSVITLPEDSVLVGLENNSGLYDTRNGPKSGLITLEDSFLKTNFVSGVYEKIDPRLDAVAPMYINVDSHGGSKYIVLFNDRGDAAIEKSYARLGGADVVMQNIEFLPPLPESSDQEYRVHIIYKLEGLSRKTGSYVSIPKEVTIPIVDGHFDPSGTITK